MTLNKELITVQKDVLDKIIKTIDTSANCTDCLLYRECALIIDVSRGDYMTCGEILYNLLKGGENHA